MGALQGLIHWTNGHLPLSHRASPGLEKGRSGEVLATLWRRASPPTPPRPFLSSGALPKDSPAQVAAGSVAGTNRQQPQESGLQESWDPRDPPGLSSASLAQCA